MAVTPEQTELNPKELKIAEQIERAIDASILQQATGSYQRRVVLNSTKFKNNDIEDPQEWADIFKKRFVTVVVNRFKE